LIMGKKFLPLFFFPFFPIVFKLPLFTTNIHGMR
jgi:hypothetical protein